MYGIFDAQWTSCTSFPTAVNQSFRVAAPTVTTSKKQEEGHVFSCSLTSKEHFNLTATMSSFSEKELICPQCTDIYCFPVLLKCGHNICRVCLQKFWEWKGSRECPVCQIVSVLGRPPINLELKLAADEYQQHYTSGSEEICLLHKKRLTIFCQNDEEAICLVCQSSKKHKIHECYPVEEAAQQKKVSKNRNCKISWHFVYTTTLETQYTLIYEWRFAPAVILVFDIKKV